MIQDHWKNWQYKNTTLLLASLLVFFLLLNYSNTFSEILRRIGTLGYTGAFLSGLFFVSIFTVVPTTVIIFDLARTLNPLIVAVFAGLGAVLGDYLIFRFLKDKVFEELSPIFSKTGGTFIKKLFMTPFFIWLIPIIGAFIIASPLPDEIGISLLGLSKVKTWHFIVITFLLNSIGIFLIIILAQSI